ncbi:hypothetical protein FH972_003617 [Carpinus fangiana]|uniref:Uncharacterized protein n=1 Tax=Carpinus fangiana TaxID=176857 RepID=A0A5N6QKG1_9ROSI|nr:hypothetical protein FH972_003617 [Carpinus fangiana]
MENASKEQSQLDVHEMMTIMHPIALQYHQLQPANDDTGGKEVLRPKQTPLKLDGR